MNILGISCKEYLFLITIFILFESCLFYKTEIYDRREIILASKEEVESAKAQCIYKSDVPVRDTIRFYEVHRIDAQEIVKNQGDSSFKAFSRGLELEDKMPKYIHTISSGGVSANTKFFQAWAQFRLFNLKIHSADDIDNIIIEEYPEFSTVYEKMGAGEKLNFMKYIVVYKYGGYYISSGVLNEGRVDPAYPLYHASFDFEQDNFMVFASSINKPIGTEWPIRSGIPPYPVRISEHIFYAKARSKVLYTVILNTLHRTHRIQLIEEKKMKDWSRFYTTHYTSGSDVLSEVVFGGVDNSIFSGCKIVDFNFGYNLHVTRGYDGLDF